MNPIHRLAVLSLVFHAWAIWCGWGVVQCSAAQAHELKRAAELSDFKNKVTSTVVKAGNRAVAWGLSWFRENPQQEERDEYEHAVASAAEYGRQAMRMSSLLAGTAALFIAFLHCGVLHSTKDGQRLYVRHLCYTSAVLFLVGISAVAMRLVAFKDLPIIGRVIFKFEAKGIADTIIRLFTSGNVFLGGLIFLFSIVFPLAKLGATWYATQANASNHDIAMRFITALGKWSMADVFVLAVILSCFAIDGDALTDAKIGPGVFFFSAYCALSIWAGVCLGHVSREQAKTHDA